MLLVTKMLLLMMMLVAAMQSDRYDSVLRDVRAVIIGSPLLQEMNMVWLSSSIDLLAMSITSGEWYHWQSSKCRSSLFFFLMLLFLQPEPCWGQSKWCKWQRSSSKVFKSQSFENASISKLRRYDYCSGILTPTVSSLRAGAFLCKSRVSHEIWR